MKILLVSGSFPPMPCGVGDYTAHLAQALGRSEDIRVGVLTSRGMVTPIPGNVEILPLMKSWRIREVPRIVDCMRNFSPDVVHIQYPTNVYRSVQWLLPAIARISNGPVVQTWHEYIPSRYWPMILNAITPGGLVVVRPAYLERTPFWCRWFFRWKDFRFIPNAATVPIVSLSESERRSLRVSYDALNHELLVYFGFAYPPKGIEALFEIANPDKHRLVLICDLHPDDPYHQSIISKTNSPEWAGKVFVTGFLSSEEASRILAAADAAVFPFRDGGGLWNTSLHAAVAQGTFVLTTSREQKGYDSQRNVFFSSPGDISAMRRGLQDHIGKKVNVEAPARDPWSAIADAHVELYRSLLSRRTPHHVAR